MKRIGDLLTKTQFKFQIRDFGQLGESLKLASPILAQYNVKLEQGLTLLGMLNSAGLQGSMAGTALSATMRNLSKASEEFNFQLVRNADGSFNFIKTMENLSESIGGFDDLDQDTIDRLQTAFGDEGIHGVVLLGKKLKELSAAQDDVAKSSRNIVDESYEAFLNDSQGQYDLAAKNIRLIGLSIANTMLPAINAILTPVAEVAAWVGNAIDQFPILDQTIGFAVVGFVLYKTAAIGAALWTGNFGKALDLLTPRKIPRAILGLGSLAKAKTLAAVAGAGGSKALLGLAGKAGAAGYGAGSLIYKGIEGTTAADKIGEGVANLLAFFGNDEAKAAIEARDKAANYIQANFYNGLRPEEMMGQEWPDLDFRKRLIKVQRAVSERRLKSVKTEGSERTIEMNDYCFEAYQRQRELTGFNNDRIWVNNLDEALIDYETVNNRLKKYCRLVGIRYRSSKQLRKSYASNRLSQSTTIQEIYSTAAAMGHRGKGGNIDISTLLKDYADDIPREGNISAFGNKIDAVSKLKK